MTSHRAPRRRRPPGSGGTEARLDELLRSDAGTPDAAAEDRSREAWYLNAALQIFLGSAVVYTLFRGVGLAPPYPLVVAACAGAVLVRRSVLAAGEPPWLRTAEVVERLTGPRGTDEAAAESRDGMIDAIRRWERRLDWGLMVPLRFSETISRRLGAVADERLRQRHGITRTTDPLRARSLLGEDLWRLLHDQSRTVPSRHEIATAVRRLEGL